MYCTVLYRYESRLDQYNASIAVIWDRDNVMDRTNITLYKCGLVGSYRYHPDCRLCMTRYCTVLSYPILILLLLLPPLHLLLLPPQDGAAGGANTYH